MKEFTDFPSAKISWFRCGGVISHFCILENYGELSLLLEKYKQFYDKTITIGCGSNILFRDAGYDGLVIKLMGEDFTNIECIKEDDEFVYLQVGAGVFDKQIANFALKNNIIGGEFLDTIPGTIGGAIATNAGCFGKEIKDILYSADVFVDGERRTMYNDDFKFTYRHGELPKNAVVLNIILKLKHGGGCEMEASADIIARMRKHRSQNQIIGATCGSTFANPVDDNGNSISAWKLIEQVGLKGYCIGGAKFSEKHCNFIVNIGGAIAGDIENLILLAKQRVRKQFGIELREEIKIIGNKI